VDAIEEHHAIDGRACVLALCRKHLAVIREASIDETNDQTCLFLLENEVVLPEGNLYFSQGRINATNELFEAFDRHDHAVCQLRRGFCIIFELRDTQAVSIRRDHPDFSGARRVEIPTTEVRTCRVA